MKGHYGRAEETIRALWIWLYTAFCEKSMRLFKI